MIVADCHTHSDFSTDSKTPMEVQIQNAIQKKLEYLCFTDHMDFDYPDQYGGGFTFDVNQYLKQIEALKEKYRGEITLLTGVELGMQSHLSKRCGKFIHDHPFDFVICSTHLVDKIDPYYPEFWTKTEEKKALTRYFESILDTLQIFQDFDIYGHLDYITRYAPSGKFLFQYKDYANLLDEILTLLIKNEKGIEVNTCGLRYGKYTNPHTDIIKRYIELGGECITIGSDGHDPLHLAFQFKTAEELLKSFGVSHYAVYKNRKPCFLKLE